MSLFRISGKNLGQLNNPDVCHECFQVLLGMNHSTPYNIFPGVFSTFDSMQKKFVRGHLKKFGTLPSWLKLFTDGTKPADTPYKLQYHDEENDILLTGIPDEVLVRPDGSLLLLDYKTAKHTGNQDALLPIYEAQVNSYAWMLGKGGHGEVTQAGLIYFEPDSIRVGTGDESFAVGFKASEILVDIDPDMTPKLLKLARSISDMNGPATRKEGCFNCDLRDCMLAIQRKFIAVQDSCMRYLSQKERSIYLADRRAELLSIKDYFLRETPVGTSSAGLNLLWEWDWS